MALAASAKVGFAKSLRSVDHSPTAGAREGRVTVTAITSVRTAGRVSVKSRSLMRNYALAAMMLTNPIHPRKDSLSSV